jgi:hypothetical protein
VSPISFPSIAIEQTVPVILDKYLEDGQACVLFDLAGREKQSLVDFPLDLVGYFPEAG